MDRTVRDPGDEHAWSGETPEWRACEVRDAAVAAARELLAKHAAGFDHDARVGIEIRPGIEWAPPAPEDDPDAGQD